jgi:hypothetical protein
MGVVVSAQGDVGHCCLNDGVFGRAKMPSVTATERIAMTMDDVRHLQRARRRGA